jgi:hypothetical protein
MISLISFKIIATDSHIEALKTRNHIKTYTVHECKQTDRIGYISELVQTFDLAGTLIKSSQRIKSYYFGFPNTSQAEKFADCAKYKFPDLQKLDTHCEARLSKRLKSPFEVKIRNLKEIEENLHAFFFKCIDQELNGKKVVEIDVNEVKKRFARL